MLADIHERLAGVVIEQLPFDQFIARYDRPGMLFYLDPPYWGCETDYGADVFTRADFARLAAQLAARAANSC
jgi:DNA adenine methylase